MNDKDFLYIKTVADEGGISQAAKKLYVSQPALSQSVKRIEEGLGVLLFRRTPRGLLLTAEGEEYYRMASKILSIYSDFEENLQNRQELKTGTVAVGTAPHQGLRLLPKILAAFYMKYPGITVNVREGTAAELQELLLRGAIDLAFIRETTAENSLNNILARGLLSTSFLILLPQGHPAGRHAVRLEGSPYPVLDPIWLREENFLLPDPTQRLRDTVLEILRKAGIPNPRSNYFSIYSETLAILAAAGKGAAILPTRYYDHFQLSPKPESYAIPERYGTYWNVSLVTLKDAVPSRATAAFLEEVYRHVESSAHS